MEINHLKSLQDYWDRCNAHMWNYEFIPSPKLYNKGYHERQNLMQDSTESSDHTNILHKFARHHNTGSIHGTPKEPRPERP